MKYFKTLAHVLCCWLACSFYTGAQPLIELPGIRAHVLIASGINGGPTLAASDNFGRDVAYIGDINNDGIEDMGIGAPYTNGSGTDRGAVYICFMNSANQVSSRVMISDATPGIGSTISNNDHFGISIAGIGDVNGDGYDDIAVGAPGSDFGGTDAGIIYIIFLDPTASIVGYQQIGKGIGNFPPSGTGALEASSSFGMDIANIGDLDGDSIADLAVGAFQYHQNDEGAVYTLRIDNTGSVKTSGWNLIDDAAPNFFYTLDGQDHFGICVSAAGDLNHDSIPDIIVGAHQDDDAYTDAGAYYLVCLDATGAIVSNKKLSYPLMANDYYPYYSDVGFGTTCTMADVNEDGIADIIAGTYQAAAGNGGFMVMTLNDSIDITAIRNYGYNKSWNYTSNAGALGSGFAALRKPGSAQLTLAVGAYVYKTTFAGEGAVFVMTLDSLDNNFSEATVRAYTKIGDFSGNFPATLDNADFFGGDAAVIGDLDGDGISEIVAGAHLDDDNANNTGAVYVIFPDSLGRVASYKKLSYNTNGLGTGLDADDLFGTGICAAGDFDNDGVPDVFVGAMQDDDGGSNRGAVYLLCLNSNGTVKTKTKISNSVNLPLLNGDNFGIDIDTIGDLNNDGVVDLVVGAYRNIDGGITNSQRGAVYIVFLDNTAAVIGSQRISSTAGGFGGTLATNAFFGVGVDGAGDLDYDGVEDIIVGAQGLDGTGAIFVIYLNTNGTVKDEKKINVAAGNFPSALDAAGNFGSSVESIPDIDGNGVRDLLIGNKDDATYGAAKGCVWIALLDSGTNVIDTRMISDSAGKFYTNLSMPADFGFCVRYAGTDSIGNMRLLIGSPRDNEGGTQRGALFTMTVAGSLTARYATDYAELKRIPDAGATAAFSGRVRFVYEEEYQVGTAKKLQYRLYKNTHQLIGEVNAAGVATYIGSPLLPIVYGRNKLVANFSGLPLTPGYYLLEVTTSKNEKKFLKFKI